jgi:hypothetical protein
MGFPYFLKNIKIIIFYRNLSSSSFHKEKLFNKFEFLSKSCFIKNINYTQKIYPLISIVIKTFTLYQNLLFFILLFIELKRWIL